MNQHWLGVELRHLAALEAIEAERSFRGAADRLGYVQSAVSQQLSTLERLVGARLVERSRGHSGVELTEAGTVLLHHTERILSALSAARADLDTLMSKGGRTVRLGVFESVAARIIPPVLSRLAADHPDVRVQTTEASLDGDLFDAVAEGDLDCAFAELPLQPGPFEAIELMVDPTVLVVAADSPVARREQAPKLDEIVRLPLAFPSWRMRELLEQHFLAAGLDPTQVVTLKSNMAVQALAKAGLAAAIMPLLAVEPDADGIKVIDLEGILPSRTLVLYWHKERMYGPALQTLVEVVRGVCAKPPADRNVTTSTTSIPPARFRPRACEPPVSDADGETLTALAS